MRNRKTPTWAYITGIFMMLMGGCGIKNDIQSIKIRDIIQLKDDFLKNSKIRYSESTRDSLVVDTSTSLISIDTISEESVTIDSGDDDSLEVDDANLDSISKNGNDGDEFDDFFGGMLDVPERVIKWLVIFGYIGLFISILFILGGLFLIVIKNFSIKLAYLALGVNIFFNLMKWVVLSGDDVTGIVALSTGISQAMGIFFSIILLVVIASCDKSEYEDDVYTD